MRHSNPERYIESIYHETSNRTELYEVAKEALRENAALRARVERTEGTIIAMREWLQRCAEWGGGRPGKEGVVDGGLKWSDAVNWLDHLNSPAGDNEVRNEVALRIALAGGTAEKELR